MHARLSLLPCLILLFAACGGDGDLYDFDGDGSLDGEDCAPEDPLIYPGATEVLNNDVDENCDGVDGNDRDGDGYAADSGSELDCDDTNASIHPGATEICDNGLDDDCDEASDMADPEGCDCAGNPDTDGDGVFDCVDNCPDVSNPLQEDSDQDGVISDGAGGGDACDACTDEDGDGYGAGLEVETCPVDTCAGFDDGVDTDEDGLPDGCDDTVATPQGEIPNGAPYLYELERATTQSGSTRLFTTSRGGGIYRSDDNGSSWVRLTLPEVMDSSVLADLEVAPHNEDLLLAGTENAKIFRSEDGGLSWSETSLPSSWTPDLSNSEGFLGPVQFSEVDPNLAYARTGDQRGLRSEDGGLTWVLLTDHPQPGPGGGFHTCPHDADRVWWRNYDALAESTDRGETWTLRVIPEWSLELAVDPDEPGSLWGFDQLNLVKSTDGGASWTMMADAPGGYVDTLYFDPTNTDRLYAGPRNEGVWMSEDRGQTWTLVQDNNVSRYAASLRDVVVDPSTGTIVIASNNGILRSSDAGDSFERSNSGLDAYAALLQVVASPHDPNVVLTRTYSGIYRSDDGGLTWTESDGPFNCLSWKRPILTADAHTEGRWFLACGKDGVYSSTNDGLSFEYLSMPEDPDGGYGAVDELVVHPTVPNRLLGVSRRLVVSDDAGVTWTPGGLESAWSTTLAVHPTSPSVMYLGRSGGMVLWSVDGGESWSEPTQGPISASGANGIPRAITPDPDNNLRAWMHEHTDVHLTEDGGLTWTRKSNLEFSSIGTKVPLALAKEGDTVHGIVVADRSGGLRFSDDDGVTWTALPMPVIPSDFVQVGSHWLVATEESGLWRIEWSLPSN